MGIYQELVGKRAEEISYSYCRREGNTTRAVDYYIQKLFKNGILLFKIPSDETMVGYENDEIFAYDFPLDVPNVQLELKRRIVRRLEVEHNYLFHPIKRPNGEWENQIHIGSNRIKILKSLVAY